MVGGRRRDSGARAEDRARRYLEDQGLKLRERNVGSRRGEIDLVMEDGGTLVFVEVRYRRSSRFGSAEATVGPEKQRRLIRAAGAYLQRAGVEAPCRFDVVAVTPETVTWIADAFSA
ncbi:MAG: YraN family protein [Ectothiorhodospiraceae bacterium]